MKTQPFETRNHRCEQETNQNRQNNRQQKLLGPCERTEDQDQVRQGDQFCGFERFFRLYGFGHLPAWNLDPSNSAAIEFARGSVTGSIFLRELSVVSVGSQLGSR